MSVKSMKQTSGTNYGFFFPNNKKEPHNYDFMFIFIIKCNKFLLIDI